MTKRAECLAKAQDLVLGDRDKSYDPPKANFKRIADAWKAYKRVSFTEADVAAMLILVKTSRLIATPNHEDSWVDIAGYAACGMEVTSDE
jgi:hypothetical protein